MPKETLTTSLSIAQRLKEAAHWTRIALNSLKDDPSHSATVKYLNEVLFYLGEKND